MPEVAVNPMKTGDCYVYSHYVGIPTNLLCPATVPFDACPDSLSKLWSELQICICESCLAAAKTLLYFSL